MSGPLPPAELRARVLAAAQARPSAPRRVGDRRRAATLATGVAASAVVLAALGGPHVEGRPTGYVQALAALWLAVLAAAAWAGAARGRSMLGRPPSWRLAVAIATPLMLLATAGLAGLAWPSTQAGTSTLRQDLMCAVFTVLMALGPLVALLALRRGTDPVTPRLTGAALGAASGAMGALGIELACEHASLAHVLGGHVAPVLALTLLGILCGQWIVTVREPT